ncbi:MAG: porin [Gammaproteobacteria bacterium]|nr:porin [Gammaproteobacteria bacterium]
MKKRFLAIAIAAGLTSPLAAQADATVYGIVHMSVGTQDTGTSGVDNWTVESHASRLGVKGSEDLGDGLSAVYKLEYGVNPDGNGADDDGITRRNQYVGLKGGFGEVRVGRHDTPLKMAQGKFDQFNDTKADIQGTLSISQGENRVDNAIAYINKFGDITLGVALVPGEGNGTTGGDGPADTTSIAAMYSAGPVFASLAMDSYDDTGAAAGQTDGLMRLVATYTMGKMQFGFLMENESANGGVAEKDVMGLSFGMGMGKNKAKFQYMTGDDDAIETTQMSVGYDVGLSKRSTAYVMYTDGDSENTAGTTTAEYTALRVGVQHKF